MNAPSSWIRLIMVLAMFGCGYVIWTADNDKRSNREGLFGVPVEIRRDSAGSELAAASNVANFPQENTETTPSTTRVGEANLNNAAAASTASDSDNRSQNVAFAPARQGVIASLTIFILAIFIGFEIITKVPPTLHTPLMSGSNAVSGITIVGALIVAGAEGTYGTFLGLIAVILATINVVGGFFVTHRMLAMFKKR